MQQTGLVQKFDYGTEKENKLIYGQVFNLNLILKIYFFNLGKENYLLFTTKCIIGYFRGWKNEIS